MVARWGNSSQTQLGDWLTILGRDLPEVVDDEQGDENECSGTRPPGPFNVTPMAVNSISSGSPHVRPMGVHRTCGA